MPPMSVAMQALTLVPDEAPPVPVSFLAGDLLQPAAASARPPTASAATSFIPRAARKTVSFPLHRDTAVVPLSRAERTPSVRQFGETVRGWKIRVIAP